MKHVLVLDRLLVDGRDVIVVSGNDLESGSVITLRSALVLKDGPKATYKRCKGIEDKANIMQSTARIREILGRLRVLKIPTSSQSPW